MPAAVYDRAGGVHNDPELAAKYLGGSELVPRRKSPCMFWFSGISFNMITGCGACGQRGARWITGLSLSTASAPVRRRRIVHKSTAFFGFGEAARNPLGFVARPQAWSAASIVFQNPNDCLGS